MSQMLSAQDEAAALEQLHALDCTDGLPVVIPTEARVARMVLASGLDRDLALGEMGPGQGIANIEKVAIAAVMAGCLPDHMPILVAAVQAILDPSFDLTEMQSTTHCTAPLVIVNGPARLSHGPLASGFGALGPGHRANASIGRALRLTMINIGGARPGVSDMALTGHPGKFTYCLAEDEEASPFPALHTSLGFEPDDSVVTVVGAEAPHSVLFSGDRDSADQPELLLDGLAAALSRLGSNNAVLTGGVGVAVLNPEHAALFAQHGLGRADIAAGLHDRCQHPIDALQRYAPAFAARRPNEGDDRHRHCFASAEDILILVAGGNGLYSMVMPSWCGGPHRNRAVSRAVTTDQYCELP